MKLPMTKIVPQRTPTEREDNSPGPGPDADCDPVGGAAKEGEGSVSGDDETPPPT